MPAEEILIPYPVPRQQLTPATQLRSTLITSSIQSLRAHGYYDRYVAALKEPHRTVLTTTVAGVWLPMSLGMMHYEICNGLGLTVHEQFNMGLEVGARLHGTLLGLAVRTAKNAGVTPWVGLAHAQRLYERVFLGGGAASLIKLGPKEARIEVAELPLGRFAYFRNGLRGIIAVGAELFCSKAYAHEIPKLTNDRLLAMRCSWA